MEGWMEGWVTLPSVTEIRETMDIWLYWIDQMTVTHTAALASILRLFPLLDIINHNWTL